MRLTLQTLAALAFTTSAALAETMPAAPNLAEQDRYLTNEVVITVDAPVEEAFAFWEATPVTDFVVSTDRIPEIEGFEVLRGPWGEPGSIRRVTFTDGGTALERVLTNDGTAFSYQIWNIETGSGRFIDHIYGEFEFVPAGDGTNIEWRYNIKPSVFFARPFIRSFLRNDFAPFMERGMAGLAQAFENRR